MKKQYFFIQMYGFFIQFECYTKYTKLLKVLKVLENI